jgi:hypothetical protein
MQGNAELKPGTSGNLPRCPSTGKEERTMPLLLLWAVPAVIVIGGAGYWLVHVH